MAKKRNTFDIDKKILKSEAAKATNKLQLKKSASTPVSEKRKMIRIKTSHHFMAKTAFMLSDFKSMQSYIEHLIEQDIKEKYPNIYEKSKRM